MASAVDICNVALGHLGDTATVVSITPPDSSVQAQLCARFYPIARDALLEMSAWGFATKRIQLAQVTLPTYTDSDGNTRGGTWQFGYSVPADMVNVLAVLPAEALDDYEGRTDLVGSNQNPEYVQGYVPGPGELWYSPQPYALETDKTGNDLLLTNVSDAVLRYTAVVNDTTKFSPLFVLALSYLLASMLAGPIIKGDAGKAAGDDMLTKFGVIKGQATSSDANQHKSNVQPAVGWIRGR